MTSVNMAGIYSTYVCPNEGTDPIPTFEKINVEGLLIEHREHRRRGLMYCTNDGFSLLGHSLENSHDLLSHERVQSGSWLVAEQQRRGRKHLKSVILEFD